MIIAVGSQTRKLGRTAVICSLIRALPEYDWTAVKISPHRHGALDEPPNLLEESDPQVDADTGRYLAAGAKRSFWLRVPNGELGSAAELLRDETRERNCLLESTSIVGAMHTDAFLLLLDPSNGDWKDSAKLLAPRADAMLVRSCLGFSYYRNGQRCFAVPPPEYANAELTQWVRELGTAFGVRGAHPLPR